MNSEQSYFLIPKDENINLSQGLKVNNWWLNQTVPKIPLGIGMDGNVVWMRYPVFQEKMISDTVLIAGGTGSGKSVQGKLIAWFLAKARPILVFDWKGLDSYLMRYPNSQPFNLPPHTYPEGIKGIYLYYACRGSRLRASFERIIKPNICKYNQFQLEALGFSPGAAKYLKNIIHRYGPFRSLESLYQFIEYFPYNESMSRRVIKQIQQGKIVLKHKRIYKPKDTINAQSKESIKKILPSLIEKGVFRLDNRYEFNFKEAFMIGKNIVFSFNDKEVGRVEINYFMKQIETIRMQEPRSPKYFVMIEEAHKVLAFKSHGVDELSEVLEDFVLTCRKLGVGLLTLMPEVTDIGDRVLNDMKNIITGKFKGENARKLINTIADYRARIIPFLRYNRFFGPHGDRELLYYNQDYGTVFRYKPFNSPCEIHRE